MSTAPLQPPVRLSLLTLNLWNTEHLQERRPALQAFFQRFPADVICLQELREETLALLDELLGHTHARVRPEDRAARGWVVESNILWRDDTFELEACGEEDIGLLEQHRRLFWVDLRHMSSGRLLHVCTAHFTWEGSKEELETGRSGRVDMTHAVQAHLESRREHHQEEDAALVFAGDLNDRFHPRRILNAHGLVLDTHTQLGLPIRSSWPTPSWGWPEDKLGVSSDNPCDFIFTSPGTLPAISSQVLEFSSRGVFPSDHYPVQAIVEWKSGLVEKNTE